MVKVSRKSVFYSATFAVIQCAEICDVQVKELNALYATFTPMTFLTAWLTI